MEVWVVEMHCDEEEDNFSYEHPVILDCSCTGHDFKLPTPYPQYVVTNRTEFV